MLTEFTSWLFSLVVDAFNAAWTFISDVLINFLGLVANGFATLVSAIPVPSFISNGLGTSWAGMDSGVLYVVSQCGVPAALAVIGAGYAFRLTRKFLTLFQW